MSLMQLPLRVGGTRESVAARAHNDRFIRNAAGNVIAVASEGSLDEARKIAGQVVQSVNAIELVRRYNERLNSGDDPKPPTGDDYNELLTILGIFNH